MENTSEVSCTKDKPEEEINLLLYLFDRKEVDFHEKKRRTFECTRPMEENTYEMYQSYMLNVLGTIKEKIKKLGAENNAKMIELQQTYEGKINDLILTRLGLFPESVEFLNRYTAFCSKNGLVALAKTTLQDMLHKYGDSTPRLYEVALTNYYILGWSEEFRVCMMEALTVHNNHSLTLKCVQLVLDRAKENRNQCLAKGVEIDETDSEMTTQRAEDIYSYKILPAKQIYQLNEVLELCREYDFAVQLEKTILKDLTLHFGLDEKVQNILINNDIYHMKKQSNGKELSREQIVKVSIMYKHAVKQLNTEKMLCFYIDWLHELIQNDKTSQNLTRTLLFNALEKAHQQIPLPEKYYILWVEMAEARNKSEKGNKILELISEKHLHSVKLTEVYLKSLLKLKKTKQAMTVFHKGVEVLGKEALPLWMLLLKHKIMQGEEKKAELRALYMKGWTQPVEVSRVLRPMYLEYLAGSSAGIKAAYTQYKKCYMQPHSLETHQGMLKIFYRQQTLSIDDIRSVHARAINQFGPISCKVWVDLLAFEIKHGPSVVRLAHEHAMKALRRSLREDLEFELKILGLWEEIYPRPLDESLNFIKVEVKVEPE